MFSYHLIEHKHNAIAISLLVILYTTLKSNLLLIISKIPLKHCDKLNTCTTLKILFSYNANLEAKITTMLYKNTYLFSNRLSSISTY